jgi:CubicO group peptidase (beta-lactamase class C family)
MTHSNLLSKTLIACVVLVASGLGAATLAEDAVAFPAVDPESVGISPAALKMLAAHTQTLVDNEEIVGGELIVIKNRRTVFRETFGWQDKESQRPLEVDSIYCVRSMTKPLVGTAIQMLIDEERLRLDTPVHEILPSFAGPKTAKITVEHLLTHSGGFRFTTLSKPLTDYADLAEVAAEAATTELLFEPGSGYEYSDAGADTLGAIVEKITGAPVEQFIQQRILDPLGMRDSITRLGDDQEVLARIPAAYSGGTASWSKHWDPSDAPIFPLFLTSQSLYSTTTDYASFLALWMDSGRVGDQRLLSEKAIERGLAPRHPMGNYPDSFKGLDLHYGQQWMVYSKPLDDGSLQRVVFGHGGSDGTHAWAWPERDMMVLFFTQSRGTLAGVGMERVLNTLLIEDNLDAAALANRVPSAKELADATGLYWDETVETAYYVVTPHLNRLTVDRPGKMRLIFKAGKTPGRFVNEASPQIWIEFTRSESGNVNAMRTSFGEPIENDVRHVPHEGLPPVEDVIAMVQQAHRIDRLAEIQAVRLTGTIKIRNGNIEGSINSLFDATHGRTEVNIGSATQIAVVGEDHAWSYATSTGIEELDGQRLEQALLDSFSVLYGDWTEHYESVEVLKRIERNDESVLLVRAVPREAPSVTFFIDESNGRVMRTDTLAQIPGVGIVGVQTHFGDFRDVGGMLVPFRSVSAYASQLIGRVETSYDKVETGVEVTDETFAPPTTPEISATSQD